MSRGRLGLGRGFFLVALLLLLLGGLFPGLLPVLVVTAAATVTRAGGGSEKNFAYTSFIPENSFISARNTVVLTT